MPEPIRIATYDDVLAVERIPLDARLGDATDTYSVLARSAKAYAARIAMRFILLGDPALPSPWKAFAVRVTWAKSSA